MLVHTRGARHLLVTFSPGSSHGGGLPLGGDLARSPSISVVIGKDGSGMMVCLSSSCGGGGGDET
jgi:hypothetical protein